MSTPDLGHHEEIAVLPLGAVDGDEPIAIFLMLQSPKLPPLFPVSSPSRLHLAQPILHQRKPHQFDRQLWQGEKALQVAFATAILNRLRKDTGQGREFDLTMHL